jgi:hypothetical protein
MANIDFTQVPALPELSNPPTHNELRALADAAYAQYIALGGKVPSDKIRKTGRIARFRRAPRLFP